MVGGVRQNFALYATRSQTGNVSGRMNRAVGLRPTPLGDRKPLHPQQFPGHLHAPFVFQVAVGGLLPQKDVGTQRLEDLVMGVQPALRQSTGGSGLTSVLLQIQNYGRDDFLAVS
jgi:hypothetical protein